MVFEFVSDLGFRFSDFDSPLSHYHDRAFSTARRAVNPTYTLANHKATVGWQWIGPATTRRGAAC